MVDLSTKQNIIEHVFADFDLINNTFNGLTTFNTDFRLNYISMSTDILMDNDVMNINFINPDAVTLNIDSQSVLNTQTFLWIPHHTIDALQYPNLIFKKGNEINVTVSNTKVVDPTIIKIRVSVILL